ncbi:S41 family peptidase [Candidatus Gracilibacteria bacterium 28_42_T64]|nr:S41 family peptidase [Candidatus Gracilibacteria bacterium 28_42_T64]
MLKVKNKNNFALLFIIFLTSFLLGVISAFIVADKMNAPMLKTEGTSDIMSSFQKKNELNLDRFWEVYSFIKNNNYDADQITKDDLVDSAIKGLVNGLDDKHSEYMTADETTKFNEVLSGDFEGIGAVVEKNELGVVIDRVIKGSPAKKYGLRSADIIIKANDNELGDLGLYEAVELIKGPAGTSVTLEVLRKGEKSKLEITVIRDRIKIPSIDFEKFDEGNLGYISINMFGDNTAEQFRQALVELKDTDGLIIDLRDNGGGYLISAVQILSNLIENGKILVSTKYKDILSTTVYKSINSGEIYDKKIVVIINENSASASEITAGALSDYKKAILVGNKSYGKGSVQKPFDLEGGRLLKLTIAKWFTPNDKNIDKEGIDPDIKVEYTDEDFENQYDRPLEESKKILKDFIKIGALKLTVDTYNKEEE